MDISCLASMFYKFFNRKFTSVAGTCIKANIDGPWYWVAIKSKYTSNQKLVYELRRSNIRKFENVNCIHLLQIMYGMLTL